MANYTKTADFAAKDSLPSGDPNKVVRGSEFEVEFDNISTAIATKANSNNSALTGSATAVNLTVSGTLTATNVVVSGNVDGRDVSVDGTKLDTIETNADVTDTANVTAAGALMDSELTNIAAVKALNQGVSTTDNVTFGTVTVDGLTVDGGITTLDSGSASVLVLERSGGTDANTLINFNQATEDWYLGANTSSQFVLTRQLNADIDKAFTVDPNGDISFYEDTGTTAKFFWDASAERLGIGTTSPAATLHIERDGSNTFRVVNATDTNFASSLFGNDAEEGLKIVSYGSAYAAGSLLSVGAGGVVLNSTTDMGINAAADKSLRFGINNTERARIDSSGKLLVGTTTAFTGGALASSSSNVMYVDGGLVRKTAAFTDFDDVWVNEDGAVIEAHSAFQADNRPGSESWHFVKSVTITTQIATDIKSVIQTATSITGRIYTRYNSDITGTGTWSSWVEK